MSKLTRNIKSYRLPLLFSVSIFFYLTANCYSQESWFEKESPNFKIIYKQNQTVLADYLLSCAEKSLSRIRILFNFTPSSKIILNTFDLYDYGFGEATSIPQNYIHIEIEPLETGYENIPYNERFQWMLNHELVHIAVNDQALKLESFARTLFSKVAPEQIQPLTVLYSLLTNQNRYTPVWHQEAIAIYLETWLSGGFGRVLGSFDEMYFRSLVFEKKSFPSISELNSCYSEKTFLYEMAYYLYGARFASFLASKYGNDALLSWYKDSQTELFENYKSKFQDVFGNNIDDSWQEFVNGEEKFQKENIIKLSKTQCTVLEHLNKEAFGWVSQPFYDKFSQSIIYAFHTKDKLAQICRFSLSDSTSKEICSLPTPSLSKVTSSAFDSSLGFYFYTTNNNQLYRDINVLDIATGRNKQIFKDQRVGSLTISSRTKRLWGVRHNAGAVSIVYSDYPYREFYILKAFPIGEEVNSLSISPSGKYLAAIFHKSSGEQQLLLIDLISKAENKILYDEGNPDNPSWSGDESRIYFNSYTNGVSNIFQYNLKDGSTFAITNTLRGLFKPIEMNDNKIFAFEFTTDGFTPVIFYKKDIKEIPAIEYFGQKVFEKNPELKNYLIPVTLNDKSNIQNESYYNGLSNLKINSFIPVITGFQSSIAVGIFSRISDPLLYHDFSIEAGYSVYDKIASLPKFHIKTKYEYKKEFYLGLDYNATDFYDLFNIRKKGMVGGKYYAGYNYYWVYDNPLKINQVFEIAYYNGVKSYSDNLIPVTEPDFIVAQTTWSSKNLRRSIGSTGYENGDEFDFYALLFGSDFSHPQLSGQLYGRWNKLFNWIAPHNTFSFQVAAGYRFENENHFQSKFFFGGFGNREVENIDVHQFRDIFRFPGIPIFDLVCDKFMKIGLENVFPPIWVSNLALSGHYLHYVDFSCWIQSLIINSESNKYLYNCGSQINFVFIHWYNLESTLSFGVAKAFSANENGTDWFVSLKLLKN